MVGSNAYNYINVLNKAANASYKRGEVIANNIVNKDTPDYKRKDVAFENYLIEELRGGSENLDKKVANVNLSNLNPTLFTDHGELDYRLDGNNVDPEEEQASLARNTIRYLMLLDSMTEEFSRIKSVLQK